MKKNIFKIVFLIVITIINLSCEDILNKYPLDKLYPGTYFSNENEIKLFTNNFYAELLPTANDIYGENADAIIISTLSDAVTGQRTVPASGGGWDFSQLRDINYYLENSKNCKDLDIRKQYDGLAKFFRAYFYFEKVKRFGDVPWYSKVLGSTDPDLYKPRDSRQLVMDSVIQDINYAINNLQTAKNVYRINKWTALALKSRLCLFEGTFRKYHGIAGYEFFLDECISASQILMNEGGYTIYKTGNAPYQDLFAVMNANISEIILARDYDSSLSLFHNVQGYENSSTTGKPGLAKSIVDSYLKKDGTRFTDVSGYQTMQFYDECQNRDPRLAQTIITPGYTRKGTTAKVAPNLAYTMTGYHLIKYTMESVYDDYNKSCCDIPLFRLAEVYLNFAEAKAERNTLTQTDINNSIKLLRDRVGMPNLDMAIANANPDPYMMSESTGYPNVTGSNQGVILEIRRERTIELIMEGFRYYDIMRWKSGKRFEKDMLGMYIPGAGTYDLNKDGKLDVCFYTGDKPSAFVSLFFKIGQDIILSNGTSGNIICNNLTNRIWDENKDYLYPIPIRERSLSNGIITQNPGWNDGLSFKIKKEINN